MVYFHSFIFNCLCLFILNCYLYEVYVFSRAYFYSFSTDININIDEIKCIVFLITSYFSTICPIHYLFIFHDFLFIKCFCDSIGSSLILSLFWLILWKQWYNFLIYFRVKLYDTSSHRRIFQ